MCHGSSPPLVSASGSGSGPGTVPPLVSMSGWVQGQCQESGFSSGVAVGAMGRGWDRGQGLGHVWGWGEGRGQGSGSLLESEFRGQVLCRVQGQ